MSEEKQTRRIAVLGATSTIGTTALEVIRERSEHLSVEVLTAETNAELLIQLALEFKPNTVVIGDDSKFREVSDALWEADIKTYAGVDALDQVVEMDTLDLVLAAQPGLAGMRPALAALRSGKHLVLGNRETLGVAGQLATQLAAKRNLSLLPVEAGQSAIFQCLSGEFHNPIANITLMTSGGPFRGWSAHQLATVSAEQVLQEAGQQLPPTAAVDSSSMMDVGQAVLAAKWLFDLKPDQIDVIVHPESVIRSSVQFEDGAVKAQLGIPDPKLPIQVALAYPKRLPSNAPQFDFAAFPSLTFEQPEPKTFRNLALAFEALKKGGNMPCILNAANEVAVAAFLNNQVSFSGISDVIEACLGKGAFVSTPTYEDYLATDQETRALAAAHLGV